MKESLKNQLGALPMPKNDYEIVVPDEEIDVQMTDAEKAKKIQDREDIEKQAAEAKALRLKEELKKLSQPVQKGLPRPLDVNMSVLRPAGIEQLTEMQKVGKSY